MLSISMSSVGAVLRKQGRDATGLSAPRMTDTKVNEPRATTGESNEREPRDLKELIFVSMGVDEAAYAEFGFRRQGI